MNIEDKKYIEICLELDELRHKDPQSYKDRGFLL